MVITGITPPFTHSDTVCWPWQYIFPKLKGLHAKFFQFPRKALTACKVTANSKIGGGRTFILLNQIIQAMMGSQNSTQQKDWVPSVKLFLKKLKAAKYIGSLVMENIVLRDMSYWKSTLRAQMQKRWTSLVGPRSYSRWHAQVVAIVTKVRCCCLG